MYIGNVPSMTFKLPIVPRALAWSPDSQFFAIGDLYGGVSVWDLTGNCIWQHASKTDSVRAVAWSPDGELLASVHNIAKLHIRRATTGELLNDIHLPNWSLGVAFTADARHVLFDGGSRLGFFDVVTGAFRYSETMPGVSEMIAVEPAGKRLATTGQLVTPPGPAYDQLPGRRRQITPNVTIWGAETGSLLTTIESGSAHAASWSPNGLHLAIRTRVGGTVHDMRPGTNTIVSRWEEKVSVHSMAWAPIESGVLAEVITTGEFVFRNVRDGTLRDRIPAAGSRFQCGALSPDGCYGIGAYSKESTLVLLDVRSITGCEPFRVTMGSTDRYVAAQLATIGYRFTRSADDVQEVRDHEREVGARALAEGWNPEALLEVEKEDLRKWISNENQGLAAHAGLCERLMTQARKLEGLEREQRAEVAASLRAGNREAARNHALSLQTVQAELTENRGRLEQAEATYKELIRERDVSIRALRPSLNDFKQWRTERVRAMATLPSALAHLHRLHLEPPLSLVRDLLQLTAGEVPPGLERLGRVEGVRALAALAWPVASRVGLAALLLHGVPLEGWEPPPALPPARLRDALTAALLIADRVEPQSVTVPTEAIVDAAQPVDERLLTLLEIVGPKAVAQDPGLPLRLLPRLPHIRPLHVTQRHRLHLRTPIGSSGRASGSGLGGERGGFDLRGDLRALLPSQLVLPSEVLRFRHLRGELLYRAKLGQEPPQLRPTVLVLDVSPPSFGPIESVTRLAAHILGSTLLEAGIRSVLVTSGGAEHVRVLERAADLVDVWTHRTNEMADATRTFRIARAMREQIGSNGLEPIILVLSHAWFAADDDVTAVPGLRGLFVQYPQHHVSPALARHCERWESLYPTESDRVSNLLGKLLG